MYYKLKGDKKFAKSSNSVLKKNKTLIYDNFLLILSKVIWLLSLVAFFCVYNVFTTFTNQLFYVKLDFKKLKKMFVLMI